MEDTDVRDVKKSLEEKADTQNTIHWFISRVGFLFDLLLVPWWKLTYSYIIILYRKHCIFAYINQNISGYKRKRTNHLRSIDTVHFPATFTLGYTAKAYQLEKYAWELVEDEVEGFTSEPTWGESLRQKWTATKTRVGNCFNPEDTWSIAPNQLA